MSKKYYLAGLLVALAAFGGTFWTLERNSSTLKVTDDSNDTIMVETLAPAWEGTLVANDIYEEGSGATTRQVALEKTATYSMDAYLGLPSGGNTLKTHSVCYDESLDQGYIAGIMTSTIAVFKGDEVIAYVETDLGTGDFLIKDLFCDNGVAWVMTDGDAVKIDGKNLEVTGRLTLDPNNRGSATYFDAENHRIVFPIPESQSFDVYDSETLEKIASLPINKGAIFTTADDDFLTLNYPEKNTTGAYEATIWDGVTLEKINSFTIKNGVGALDAAYDPVLEELWILSQGDRVAVYDLNKLEAKPVAIQIPEIPEAHRILLTQDQVVVLTENGFDYEGANDFRGGIGVVDRATQKVIGTLELPSHHGQMDLDLVNNKVYITNNGDNSVSRVDLATLTLETVIEAGSSTESGAIASDGSLFLRNRLGGNSIMHFDPSSGDFTDIPVQAAWPVGVVYSKNLNQVFTFDFLGSSVTAIDPETDEITAIYSLGVPDGSTDAVGDMTYDYTRDIVYASIPEQNIVVALDAASGSVIKVIQVEDYLTKGTYAELGGPALLVLATYEPLAKLLVYAKMAHTLFVYDGLNDFSLEKTIVIDTDSDTVFKAAFDNFPYGFEVDQTYDRIYLGPLIYDAQTFELLGKLTYGQSVATIDVEDGILFTVAVNNKKEGKETLYALDFDGELLGQITLSENQYVKPRFAFDAVRGVLYAFYMVPSEVWVIEPFAE